MCVGADRCIAQSVAVPVPGPQSVPSVFPQTQVGTICLPHRSRELFMQGRLRALFSCTLLLLLKVMVVVGRFCLF